MAAKKKTRTKRNIAVTRRGRVEKRVGKALKKFLAAGKKKNGVRVRQVHFKGNKPRVFRGFDSVRVERQRNGTILVIGKKLRKA